jgi:ADP-ribose pyrophosphatase YjhB (NUDIX family)
MKQVYTHYDKRKTPPPNGFKHCPYCKTDLVVRESGHQSRPTCPSCGFVQFRNPAPTVSILVIDDGQVLLGKRAGEPGKGTWALPSGYIEYDDDFLTTAIQETKQETGLDVEILSIVNLVSSFLTPSYHFLSIFVAARVAGGELLAADDLDAVDWFPIAGPLPELGFQEDLDVIDLFAQEGFEGLPIDSDCTTRK